MTTITREAMEAKWDWVNYARPEQLEPEHYSIWLIKTGRGWGKTRTGSETVLKRVKAGTAHNIALVSPTSADARDIMVDELEQNSGILACAPPWDKPKYEPSKRRLVWHSGAVATIYSGEDPGQLRGPQHDFAWVDELAAFPRTTIEEVWSNLRFGLRRGSSQCIVTTTPKPIPLIRALLNQRGTFLTEGSTYDNIENLSQEFFDTVISPYEGTRVGRQELLGQILDDNPEALWTLAELDANRVAEAPTMSRIVVGVDPSGAAEGHECGITVGGLGANRQGYCLADLSMHGTPDQWAETVIKAYDTWEADCIVVERNYGGDMVTSTIRLKAQAMGHRPVYVKDVVATRGKVIRAEPISGLGQQGRIHMVGTHEILENQLVAFIAGGANDRVDSYVWTFTELMGGLVHKLAPADTSRIEALLGSQASNVMVAPTETQDRHSATEFGSSIWRQVF